MSTYIYTVNLIIKENIFKNILWNLKFKKNDLYIGYNLKKNVKTKIKFNIICYLGIKLINVQQD